MLQVIKSQQLNVPLEIKIDSYVPLVVRTYVSPIGAVYYRTGNFETSLVEIPIDPMTGILRGVTLVKIDSIKELKRCDTLSDLMGLPMIALDSCPANRIDERRHVEVSLIEDNIIVDWSENNPPLYKISCQRLSFIIGKGDYVQGVMVSALSAQESEEFKRHLQIVNLDDSLA